MKSTPPTNSVNASSTLSSTSALPTSAHAGTVHDASPFTFSFRSFLTPITRTAPTFVVSAPSAFRSRLSVDEREVVSSDRDAAVALDRCGLVHGDVDLAVLPIDSFTSSLISTSLLFSVFASRSFEACM
jgi:hypothetical protein